ncbi:MAG: hypothetical protein NZO58_04065, partial [Gemmataceae bacterium]|nr:hypothetical protein [Gemmataceae bacterium]
EALGLTGTAGAVAITRISDRLVVARHRGVAWTFAEGAVPRTSAPGTYERATCALQQLRRLLPSAGAHFGQIVRAWFYLGGIVADEGGSQRYKEFNRARTDFYEHIRFLSGPVPGGGGRLTAANGRLPECSGRPFPASTGIGTSGRGICLGALAVAAGRSAVVAVPLENPRQTSAYQYSTRYSPQSPKFSRGMALGCGRDAILLVSGTASIVRSETRHVGDVAAQTHETLENIAALISEENLARHGLPGAGTTLDGLGLLRVYLKRPEDLAAVAAICRSRLGDVPTTYVAADVCRPDLLVEIEGIAFSRGEREWSALAPATSAGEDAALESEQGGGCGCGPYCPETCPEKWFCPHAVLRPPELQGHR